MKIGKVRLPGDRAGRIYIAGPMTGQPDHGFPAFNRAAERLEAHGWDVANPADHGVVEGAEWADYLRADLAALTKCEAIFLLLGWEGSRGAQLELQVAHALGMKIIIEKQDDSPDRRAIMTSNAAVAAIDFALSLDYDEVKDFLEMWNYREVPEIRERWPECPEAVFLGADSVHPGTEIPSDRAIPEAIPTETVVALPQGWLLVPAQPTEAMVQALLETAVITNKSGILNPARVIQNALEAAPTCGGDDGR